MDLLKEQDTFESKVVGCFVRIKNDPKDYSFQKHKMLYRLGKVTGNARRFYGIPPFSILCLSFCHSMLNLPASLPFFQQMIRSASHAYAPFILLCIGRCLSVD